MIGLDHLIVLLKWTALNPLLALCYLIYHLGGTRYDYHPHPTSLAALVSSSLALLVWFINWTSHRWLNFPPLPAIQPHEWQDELVVLTGGASGIGAHLALQLAARGAKVITLDLQKSNFGAVVAAHPTAYPHDLEQTAKNIHPYICDLASAEAVAKVVASIKALHGAPTILINNAGTTNSRALIDSTQAQVTNLLNVNLACPLWLIQAFLPGMLAAPVDPGRARPRRRPCHIVSIASIMGHVGISRMVDYSASKHGLVGLHKALRYELAAYHRASHIRTSLVVLGHVRTSLFDRMHFNPLATFLAPTVEPETVARTIVEQLRTRSSDTLALPWYANWTEAIALFPSWMADLVHWVAGSNRSFDERKKGR